MGENVENSRSGSPFPTLPDLLFDESLFITQSTDSTDCLLPEKKSLKIFQVEDRGGTNVRLIRRLSSMEMSWNAADGNKKSMRPHMFGFFLSHRTRRERDRRKSAGVAQLGVHWRTFSTNSGWARLIAVVENQLVTRRLLSLSLPLVVSTSISWR